MATVGVIREPATLTAQSPFTRIPSGTDGGAGRRHSPPEFFHTFQSAADYAGVDRKTIYNWKRSEWLPVHQDGRKVRIARADWDKCRKKR
jgi:excisionase family DNA binding protein